MNDLEGTVPTEISLLTELTALFVADNAFFGTMPNHTAIFFDVAPFEFLGDPPDDNYLLVLSFVLFCLIFGGIIFMCRATMEDLSYYVQVCEGKLDNWANG